MRRLWTATLLITLSSSTGLASEGPCVDTPNGIPIARGD